MSAVLDLDNLFAEALATSPVPTGGKPSNLPVASAPTMGGLKKISYTHDALIDLMIAHPEYTQNQLAATFGYSASWISNIFASDAFKARAAERRKEIVDPALMAEVESRFEGLVRRSLAILEEKLNAPAAAVSDQLALRTLEIAAKAKGYGARETPVVVNNVTNHLEVLGSNLTNLLRRKRAEAEIIDAETEILPSGK